ncbi:unannotated protein [freshwater metagenome]|uniref:Unannotated protein n=1 Tax=freshwater metagenome TaxID=449393 RepID=A0A6J7KJW4_9ZZZZ|nr:hypothetical protein [Actinomycetota bacterium]
MSHPSASPSPSSLRASRALVPAAVVLALGVAAPAASAAPGVFKGSGNDAAGDAPSGSLDINGADVVYNQNTGRVKGTIRMSGRPPGDVDVLFGKRQASGACSVELTLNSNVAQGTGELRGSAGGVRAKATVSFANNVVTVAATDAAVSKKTIDCATANSYGAGVNHTLRDTIRPAFDVTERVADPVDPEDVVQPPVDDGSEEPFPGEDPGGFPPEGVDTDGDGIPDDFDGDGVPDDLGFPGEGADGTGSAAQRLSVRVYGVPKRLKRGRSYEIRVRLRNETDQDATRLRVRLGKKTGVAMSRRVASVSKVRSGKGVTVHFRVRLTSAQAKRTVRVSVTGGGVEERRSFVLRRRGAR